MLGARLLASICLCAISSWGHAQELTIDPHGALLAFSNEKGWAEPAAFVDEAFIEELRLSSRSTKPKVAERLIKALETTYFGAEVGGLVAPSGAYSVTYLKKNEELVLMQFFLATVDATETEVKEWLSLLKNVTNDELLLDGTEIVERTWEVYLDPTKREFEHGWVNLSSIENRAMAWGVPPDFVEVVVSARTDCEFLPVRGWLARHLCP